MEYQLILHFDSLDELLAFLEENKEEIKIREPVELRRYLEIGAEDLSLVMVGAGNR